LWQWRQYQSLLQTDLQFKTQRYWTFKFQHLRSAWTVSRRTFLWFDSALQVALRYSFHWSTTGDLLPLWIRRSVGTKVNAVGCSRRTCGDCCCYCYCSPRDVRCHLGPLAAPLRADQCMLTRWTSVSVLSRTTHSVQQLDSSSQLE